MIPFIQYRQEMVGTPEVPTGNIESVPVRLWKRTWNDGPVKGFVSLPMGLSTSWSPTVMEFVTDANPVGFQSYHPAFPDFVQIVRTASRERFAERDYDAYEESSSNVLDELVATALGSSGGWSAVTPYDQVVEVGSEIFENNLVSDPGIYHMKVRVWDCKYLIRWAPPFSSRAKIRAVETIGATDTPIEIEWNGAAGVTIDGVQRCFPAHISIPITDSMWIEDPTGERILEYLTEGGDFLWHSVGLLHATSFRNIALPAL